MSKERNLYLFLGPKRAFEAHVIHISESGCNEPVKQDWCESRGKFSQNTRKLEFWFIWWHKMAHKLGPLGHNYYTTTKVAPMSLWIKFPKNLGKSFWKKNRQNPINWFILSLFGPFWPYLGQKRPEIGLTGANFTHTHTHTCMHTPVSTHNIPVNQVSWFRIKNLCRKRPKNIVHIWVNIGTIGSKLRKPIRFEKNWRQTDGQRDRQMTDARHWISSADYVSSGAKMACVVQAV